MRSASCPRLVRHAVLCQSRGMVGQRFARAGENERSTAKNSAKKNLATAITAHVVERAPHRSALWRALCAHCLR